MLAIDSLVTDLMFQANAAFDPEDLVTALGGPEITATRKILDPDMQDPRFEMELSPSMPFRRRGERRLMIIDDSVAPMRKNPRRDPVVPLDLRPEKERLIAVCTAVPVRLGRLSALGTWGDAVIVVRDARDLRAICLLPWVLDPQIDTEGRKRATPLTEKEFETKILAYEKRIEELDESEILASLGPAKLERRGDLIVVDLLEPDGTWDIRTSLAMELAVAALEKFSLIPGAPYGGKRKEPAVAAGATRAAPRSPPAAAGPANGASSAAEPAPAPVKPAGPPLRAVEVGGRVVLIFPLERFDLDVAAALGKRDYGAFLQRNDDVTGPQRDRMHRDGAGFVAPLEFLSEVFLEGKPLSKPSFEAGARDVATGVRALDVHFPRFGPVVLLDVSGRGRFVSSLIEEPGAAAALVGA